jgi:hypothetical protein
VCLVLPSIDGGCRFASFGLDDEAVQLLDRGLPAFGGQVGRTQKPWRLDLRVAANAGAFLR